MTQAVSLNQASKFSLNQTGKDEDYAGNEPSLHGGQGLRLKPEISTGQCFGQIYEEQNILKGNKLASSKLR